ncbi:MAG: potassium/proton antiporter, partial [Acidobacteriota bacterium]
MIIPIEYILLIGALLILFSVLIVKLTDNLGVPTLLLFLGIGMLAGSEGPGGIYFDDAQLAQSIGVVALIFILYAGGLDTSWEAVKPVIREASLLAIPGVLLTALFIGLFVSFVFHLPLLSSLLLGAVVSSTDAAAVFAVLRAKNVHIKAKIRHLLELESGSNDPMAVFLTIGIIQLMMQPQTGFFSVATLFLVQMGIGGASGFILGKGMIFMHNRLRLFYEGLYPVFSIAFVVFTYAITASAGGSGFLAVYIMGLIAGNSDFIQKKSLLRFFDGLAWLSQIAMFLTLGLLVFPSH